MTIPQGPYVRALVLCGELSEPSGRLDLIGVHTGPHAFVKGSRLFARVGLFAVIERQGDRKEHTVEYKWCDPDGSYFEPTGAMPMKQGLTVVMMCDLIIDWPTWRAGRYRLVMFIDGTPAAYAPLDLLEEDARSMD